MSKKVMIVAGEKSGDMHGANLVKEIKNMDSGVSFVGIGGDRLKSSGVDLKYHMTDLAVVGLSEIFKNLKKFFSILKDS